MALTIPENARGPILELTLPAWVSALDITLRNKTTGKTLTLNLPAAWGGDDLTLNFFRRTIRDQSGADRSALLDPEDNELWTLEPLIAGLNDVEIEFSTVVAVTKSPGTLVSSGTEGGGTVAWTNPTNAASSNNVYATVTLAKEKGLAESQWLKATNFDFASAVPVGAPIEGIVLETEQIADHTSGAQGNVTDSKVRLVKAGAIAGLDQSEGLWTLVEHYVVHGASNDVWGGVTAAEVRATDFGAALLVLLFTATTSVIGSLDHIRMTVYHRGAVAYGGKASLRWDKGYF